MARDDFTGTMNAFRLVSGGRIRKLASLSETISVSRSRSDVLERDLVVSALPGHHFDESIVWGDNMQMQFVFTRRPHAKPAPPVVEPHCSDVPHPGKQCTFMSSFKINPFNRQCS